MSAVPIQTVLSGYGWVSDWRKHLKTPVSQYLGLILDKLLLPIRPDEQTLVSGSYDGKIKIWQLP